jgi:MFS family permease
LAVISLFIARVVYTINWFNIPALFYLIAADFNNDISSLGITIASFLAGIGIFQVPAGILSAIYNPKVICIAGITIISIFAISSAFSDTVLQLAISRFLVGLGMALYFGPSVTLIIRFLPKGSDGLGMGLLNSGHALGGILGMILWIVIAETTGWRASILIGGLIGIFAMFLLINSLYLQKNHGTGGKPIANESRYKPPRKTIQAVALSRRSKDIKKILTNRSLIILGVTLLGFQMGSGLIWGFIVYYLSGNVGFEPTIAGLVGALNQIVVFIASPLIGKLYDKIRNATILIVISGLLSSISIVAIGVFQTYFFGIVISTLWAGFFLSWGFVIIYARAKQTKIDTSEPQKYQTLHISYVNGISLLGIFWVPLLFATLVSQAGYPIAWIVGGIVSFALMSPILKLGR